LNFLKILSRLGKSEYLEEFLALIVRKLPSDGIMKEENREHPERFCWWCFKKGVQDGIDKNANCWF
jgi:hypothetical protein